MMDAKLQRLFDKIIALKLPQVDYDYESLVDEVGLILGNKFTYEDLIKGVWYYIINVLNEDPFNYWETEFLHHNFYSHQVKDILEYSGWMDKFFNKDDFFIIKNPNDKEIKSVYGDIKLEGGKIYLICERWIELAQFYRSNDRDTVERVLDEDWAELYGFYEPDFDSDIVDNLNDESIKHIKKYIKEGDFIGQEMSEYSMDDEHGNILEEWMVDDTETIMRLIDEEDIFTDLKSDLENWYRWAYEGAAEDELFSEFKNEIEHLLGSKGEWGMIKSSNKEGSDEHILKFDVTDVFMDFNRKYLECKGTLPQHDEHYFLNVITEYLDCDDEQLMSRDMGYFYPDSTRVEEHLNYNVLGNL